MNKVLKENSIIKEALDEIIKSEAGYVDNLADLAGPESSWMGADGWKNKGYPTMKYTWGILGTIVTAGGYSMSTIRLYNMSLSGKATYGQARWWIWDGFSLGTGIYNLVNPNNNDMNYIAPAIDLIDCKRSPMSNMNWIFRDKEFYKKYFKK